jgi:hypothetical protein
MALLETLWALEMFQASGTPQPQVFLSPFLSALPQVYDLAWVLRRALAKASESLSAWAKA